MMAHTVVRCILLAAPLLPTLYSPHSFIGVTCVRRAGGRPVWQAQLTRKSINYYLGTHDTPEDAARAYDQKARELGLEDLDDLMEDLRQAIDGCDDGL